MTRRIAPVLAVVAAFYAVFVPLRIHQRDVLWFAHIGESFLRSAHTSPAIDSVRTVQSRFGYDGQFFFMIAADPARARDYMRGDEGKRYARIGYPVAARLASAGQVGALPYALLVLNLLAVGAGTWAVAAFLVRRGRSPWFAVLYGLWPGLVFSVFRDLSEPLAFGLATLAVLLFERRRIWASCALLAVAGLTRETVAGFAVAGAVALWPDRRRALGFLAGALVPVLAWRIFVTQWLHATTLHDTGEGWKTVLPFYGMRSWWPWDGQHWILFWTAYVPLVIAGVGGAYLLYRRRGIPAAVLLVLNVAVFVVWLPHSVTIDFGAAGRNFLPALLGFLYCIPFWRDRRFVLGLSVLLSPVWFLLVASLVDVTGIDLMTK